MKYLAAGIFLITMNANSCKSQQSYKQILIKSEAEFNWRGYVDGYSVFHRSGKVLGNGTRIEVDSVTFQKADSVFSIVGQVVGNFQGDVRHGFCCYNVFLAEVKGDSLINSIKVGETNSGDRNPNEPEGYFQIRIRPKQGQRLFFTTSAGEGLHEYSLDKLIERSKKDLYW